MTVDERKSNLYFDQTGKEILPGDLLRVFHFRTKKKIHYMHHVVVMEETKDFPVMSAKSYYSDKPHYRLYSVVNPTNRVYSDAKIIGEKDWETKRIKIKI
jgi:hypothetical protein